VSKRQNNGLLALDIHSYVDDLQSSGAKEELCKQATKRIASAVNYLGMQDAPRKRRMPSKTLGTWVGSFVLTDDSGVHASVTEERLERGKLRNAELFMFTDSSTAEAAYHKGSSSNKKLFELALQLEAP
jgi:hypothetical protein